MKIAIPVFENRISPRFDCAPGVRLCEVEGDKITVMSEISCRGFNDNERVSQLKDLEVDTLICGGLPTYLLGILKNIGINVIPWVAGDTGEALKLFLRGRLNSGMVICQVGKKSRCKRGIKVQ
jgi:predicted Fe-Mo cluster-binding NifX family protein